MPLTPPPEPAFALPLDFSSAVESGDLDAAWALLSDAAEVSLGGLPPASRAAEPQLCLRDPMGSCHAPPCQSLSWSASASTAALIAPGDRAGLLRNIATLFADLPASVAARLRPPGADGLASDAALAPVMFARLQAEADAISAQGSRNRLSRWQAAVQDDVPRLAARDPPASPSGPLLSDTACWASEWERPWQSGAVERLDLRVPPSAPYRRPPGYCCAASCCNLQGDSRSGGCMAAHWSSPYSDAWVLESGGALRWRSRGPANLHDKLFHEFCPRLVLWTKADVRSVF